MTEWRILAVDDEPFNLDIIAEYLEAPFFHLVTAPNAERAWEIMEAAETGNLPHLIILDRMMPGMNGIEFLQRLKADQRYFHIPVVMQTAAAAPHQVREGIEAGAYYYLTKPYEPGALLSIVKAALADIQQRQQALQHAKTQSETLRLLQSAEFNFSSLDEALGLGALLAALCPVPDTTLLGLTELLVNAVEHGNLGISYDEKAQLRRDDAWEKEVNRRLKMPEYAAKVATIRFVRLPTELIFTISDQGNGFDWPNYLEISPERAFDPNGRGIAMARQISFTRMEYQGCGNIVVATVNTNITELIG